ncbi:hypothetical protein KSP39_PZI008737 [Platanthera zijinensis]|uniref:Uncharacterized protein n=1 Tax=Platanthera zijinensis TaxID=2320716 RepID=A0AAP0BMN3_9ASPA
MGKIVRVPAGADDIHFIVPHQRIIVITKQRIMLLQALSEELDRESSKIIWDIPLDAVHGIEFVKGGILNKKNEGHIVPVFTPTQPSQVKIYSDSFRESEDSMQVIECNDEQEGQESQAEVLFLIIERKWDAVFSNVKTETLKKGCDMEEEAEEDRDLQKMEMESQLLQEEDGVTQEC